MYKIVQSIVRIYIRVLKYQISIQTSIQLLINLKKNLFVLGLSNVISSLLSEQPYSRKHAILGERAKGGSECPLLPFPVDARDEDWRRSEQSGEHCMLLQTNGWQLPAICHIYVGTPSSPHRLAVSRFRGCFRR